MLNRKLKEVSPSGIHSVSQISQLQFIIAIPNLLSCENTLHVYMYISKPSSLEVYHAEIYMEILSEFAYYLLQDTACWLHLK